MRRRVIGLLAVLLIAWGGLAYLQSEGIGPKLGLDLQGGTSVLLTAPPDTDEEVLAQAVEIMRSRIEEVGGVQEPEISVSGGSTVLVQLPGVENEERALAAIGQTGRLSFRPVLGSIFGNEGPLVTTTTTSTSTTTTTQSGTTQPGGPTTTAGTGTTTAAVTTTAPATTSTEPGPTTTTTLPPNIDPVTGLTIEDDPSKDAYLPGTIVIAQQEFPAVLHVGPAELLGEDVADALPGFNPNEAQWVVNLDLTSAGGEKFASLTAHAASFPVGDPQREIAIVLDGKVVQHPAVNSTVGPEGITGGSAVITFGGGDDDQQQAQDVAALLRYGSLPVAFERSSVQKVSATLGSDSLQAGLLAGYIGLGLVALLLITYYRAMGVVAIVGLTVFAALLLAVFSVLGEYQGVTLTLAGVTGVIVSVGITADSYIVYFERIKEEIRGGRSVRSAVEDGFKSAFRTILTADSVSLIAAALLFFLSVGAVKGFALSLGIATLIDLFVARAFTRRATWLLAHTPLANRGWFSIMETAQ